MGTATDEPYVIERRIATGGMAEVFVAKRNGPYGFQKRVALKRILPQFSADPDFVDMFIDEARLAARLEHPNIVQVFDFGQHAGSFFIAMEWINGSNVNQLLRAVSVRDEAVPLDIALHIVLEAAAALAYAHALRDDSGDPLDVVHRDVSPANLLLTRDGHVKLSDFGIARAASFEVRTQTGQLRGKLGYMSPEQVLGRDLDGRSDVFTLSVVLAEMLIAEPLFGKGQDLDVLTRIRDVDLSVLERSKRRLPQDVRSLLSRGLCKLPEERPTAQAWSRMLREIVVRRGMTGTSARLAHLLSRLDLVEPRPGDELALEPGAKPTNYIEVAEPASLEVTTGSTAPTLEAAQYRVRSERGFIGPIAYSRLTELILGGQVDSDTMISRNGGPFERALNLAELKRFVASPALQWRERDWAQPSGRGKLNGVSLLPVVHRIVRDRETGLLYLRDGARQKKMYFVEGRPEFISSTDRSELLGEYLVASQICLRMEVDMALAVLHRYEGRLGDALVALGILRPVALVRAVQEQARRRFLEAFSWRSGEWLFVRDAQSGEETFAVLQDSCELLRDAARVPAAAELEQALLSLRDRLLVRSVEPPMPISAYRVPKSWSHLLRELNGETTLGAFLGRELASLGPEREEALRALYLGLSCEIVRAA